MREQVKAFMIDVRRVSLATLLAMLVFMIGSLKMEQTQGPSEKQTFSHIQETDKEDRVMAEVESLSESARLYMHDERNQEPTQPETLWTTQNKPPNVNKYGNEQGTSYDMTSHFERVPWNATTSEQSNQLFRPFSPASSPQPITSSAPSVYPYGYPSTSLIYPPFGTMTSDSFPQSPDAEVSFYSWLSRDDNDTRQNSPSLDCKTLTPSSVSTCNSATPTELEQWNCESQLNDTIINNLPASNTRLPMKTIETEQEPQKASYPYRRHPKPPYTYCGLIATVIENSPTKRLTLYQINDKLYDLFECFRRPYQGWRDSVRHNLSHHACFEKGDVDETSREQRKLACFWTVNLEKVPEGAFCLQRTREGKSGNYKDHIYEELGLPPIQHARFKYGSDCRCLNPLFATSKTAKKRTLDTMEQEHHLTTPQTSIVKRLQLPTMEDCSLPTDSPEIYRHRDIFNGSWNSHWLTQYDLDDSVCVKTTEKAATGDTTCTSEGHGSQLAHAHGGPEVYFRSISQYIMSTEGNSLTSNAAENLSYLCFDVTKK